MKGIRCSQGSITKSYGVEYSLQWTIGVESNVGDGLFRFKKINSYKLIIVDGGGGEKSPNLLG